VGDLYKVETTIPLAFRITAENPPKLESSIRTACRESFHKFNLLGKILPDIDRLFDLEAPFGEDEIEWDIDADVARPTPYWNPGDDDEKSGKKNVSEVGGSENFDN